MDYRDIQPRMVLRLKRERMEAYGLTEALVTVTEIVTKPGYKTPYVKSGADYFRPADFQRLANCAPVEKRCKRCHLDGLIVWNCSGSRKYGKQTIESGCDCECHATEGKLH